MQRRRDDMAQPSGKSRGDASSKAGILHRAASLMTPLGVVEGEVLTYLEQHGTTPLRQLMRELESAGSLVLMAVGSLIRQGLVGGIQRGWDVLVEPRCMPDDSLV